MDAAVNESIILLTNSLATFFFSFPRNTFFWIFLCSTSIQKWKLFQTKQSKMLLREINIEFQAPTEIICKQPKL